MKTQKIILSAILLITGQLLYGQQINNQWGKWNHLIGEWIGEGSGQPGKNEGTFSFKTDLDGKILVRKNHTVFPATTNSERIVHDDLLIVYPGASGSPQEGNLF